MAPTEAVLLHHMLQLHQEVAALKLGAPAAQPPPPPQTAPPPAPPQPAPAPAPATAPWQGWVGMEGGPQPLQWQASPHLPSLGGPGQPPPNGSPCRQAKQCSGCGRGLPVDPASGPSHPIPARCLCRPATQARPLLAEVRRWLQQQQLAHQQQAAQAQDTEDALEQMLQAAAAGALPLGALQGSHMAHGIPSQVPPLAQQPRHQSPGRRPLHEPRPPVVAPQPGGGSSPKRRQTAARAPSRWDYRPAWNEGLGRNTVLRAEDLPGSRAGQGEAGSPAKWQGAAPASLAAAQPTLCPNPAGVAGAQQPMQPDLQQGCFQAVQGAMSSPAQPPPFQQAPPPAYQSASGQAAFPPAVPLIQQYFSSQPPSPTPAALCSPVQPWQQQPWQWGPGAAYPQSRPATGYHSAQREMAPPPQQPGAASWPPQPPPFQGLGYDAGQGGWGVPAQQRPATPGAGLGTGGLQCMAGTSAAGEAYMQQAPYGAATPRPRSAKVGARRRVDGSGCPPVCPGLPSILVPALCHPCRTVRWRWRQRGWMRAPWRRPGRSTRERRPAFVLSACARHRRA